MVELRTRRDVIVRLCKSVAGALFYNSLIPCVGGKEQSTKTATIAFGGDTLLGGYYNSPKFGTMIELPLMIDRIKAKEGIEGVVNHFFNNVIPIFRQVDYSVVNLEGPITPRYPVDYIEEKVYPKMFPFRQHEETAEILSLAGIRMVSLANNHMYDFNLLEGLKSTMDFLEGKLEYVGAGVGEEAYQYKIKEINGVKISFLGLSAVVDPESMIAEGNKLGIAALPKIENYYENYYLNKLLRYVKKAKEQSDFNVILLHAGPTSGNEVSKCQRELAKILTENGVDVIIGTHSHVKQPINEIQDGYNKLKQVIFYGIGNLVFGGRRNRQEESMIPLVRFSIDEMKRKNISYEYYKIQPNINGSFVPLVIK